MEHPHRRHFLYLTGLGGAAALGAAAAWLAAQTRHYDREQVLQLQLLRLQAEGGAEWIRQFIKRIESHVGWTTQLPWSPGTMDQRRFDALRLLRQVLDIVEFAQIDSA